MVQRYVIYFCHIFLHYAQSKNLYTCRNLLQSSAVVLDFNTHICLWLSHCVKSSGYIIFFVEPMSTGQWYPSKFDIADASSPTPLPWGLPGLVASSTSGQMQKMKVCVSPLTVTKWPGSVPHTTAKWLCKILAPCCNHTHVSLNTAIHLNHWATSLYQSTGGKLYMTFHICVKLELILHARFHFRIA